MIRSPPLAARCCSRPSLCWPPAARRGRRRPPEPAPLPPGLARRAAAVRRAGRRSRAPSGSLRPPPRPRRRQGPRGAAGGRSRRARRRLPLRRGDPHRPRLEPGRSRPRAARADAGRRAAPAGAAAAPDRGAEPPLPRRRGRRRRGGRGPRVVRDLGALGGRDRSSEDAAGRLLVDLSSFLLRDAHGVATRLAEAGQGGFSLDRERSAIDPERLPGVSGQRRARVAAHLRRPRTRARRCAPTAPAPTAVTLTLHQSFLRAARRRATGRVAFDPRMGSFAVSFADYAAPLDRDVEQRWIARHRLREERARRARASHGARADRLLRRPRRARADPVRRSVEGASWWATAFEAAGFVDAFRVELLPAGAHPLDARYNVIQWVHRATRGWSYGGGVIDPRTGEIVKGHVTLGSLRVRQDRLLFEGLLGAERSGSGGRRRPDRALARAHPPARRARGRAHARLRAQLRRLDPQPGLGDGLSGAAGDGRRGRHARRFERLRDGRRGVGPRRDALGLLRVRARRRRGDASSSASRARRSTPACSSSPTTTPAIRGAAHPIGEPLGQRRRSGRPARRGLPRARARAGALRRAQPAPRARRSPGWRRCSRRSTCTTVSSSRRRPRRSAASTTVTRSPATASAACAVIGAERQRRALGLRARRDRAALPRPARRDAAAAAAAAAGERREPRAVRRPHRRRRSTRSAPRRPPPTSSIAALFEPARAARLVDFHRRDADLPALEEVADTAIDRAFVDTVALSPRQAEIARVVQRVAGRSPRRARRGRRRRALGALARRPRARRPAAAHRQGRGARRRRARPLRVARRRHRAPSGAAGAARAGAGAARGAPASRSAPGSARSAPRVADECGFEALH